MRSRVVSVDQVGIPRSNHRPYTTCGGEVPIAAHTHGGGSDAGRSESTDERRLRCRDDERFMTLLTLPSREQVHLALPAAPFSAGIQVEHSQGCGLGHIRRMRGASGARNAVRRIPRTRRLALQLTGPNVAQTSATPAWRCVLALAPQECRRDSRCARVPRARFLRQGVWECSGSPLTRRTA